MWVLQLLATTAPRLARRCGWLQKQGGHKCGRLRMMEVRNVGREAEALSGQDQLAKAIQILLYGIGGNDMLVTCQTG